jgi:hypothetical protein
MSELINKLKHLNELKNKFKKNIKLLYVLKKDKINLFIVTKDDNVFAFGENAWGALSFNGKIKQVKTITLNEKLS